MKHSIIPLFIPHYGCPHQCVFCNQVRITGQTTPVTAEDAARIIAAWRKTGGENRCWEAAYYGGSFTALPLPVMESLLRPAQEALRRGEIQAIRLSTRPDCIDEEILQLLKRMGVSTVELGAQSLDDQVLRLAERGHTAADTAQAVQRLREHGFRVGLQFMTGLPGESWQSLRRTARRGAGLRPDFIRLYPVLVLQDTPLCRLYERGSYQPLTVKEAAFRCAFLKRWYGRHGIPVIRMGLQATEELDRGGSLAAGPYHPALGDLADQLIVRHALRRALRRAAHPEGIVCHPRDRSRIMGQHRQSWHALLQEFGTLRCRESEQIVPGTAVIETPEERMTVSLFDEIRQS